MTFMSGLAVAPEHFAPTGKGFDILHYFYNKMFFLRFPGSHGKFVDTLETVLRKDKLCSVAVVT